VPPFKNAHTVVLLRGKADAGKVCLATAYRLNFSIARRSVSWVVAFGVFAFHAYRVAVEAAYRGAVRFRAAALTDRHRVDPPIAV
jgi:hypothetical protein